MDKKHIKINNQNENIIICRKLLRFSKSFTKLLNMYNKNVGLPQKMNLESKIFDKDFIKVHTSVCFRSSF